MHPSTHSTRLVPMRTSAIVVVVLSCCALWFDSLLNRVVVAVVQHQLTLLGGGKLTIGTVKTSCHNWSIALHDIRVSNPPGAWQSPYALRIGRLHIRVSNLLSLLSLHPGGLIRLGSLEFTLASRPWRALRLRTPWCIWKMAPLMRVAAYSARSYHRHGSSRG